MSDMIRDLLNPSALPDETQAVSLVQTHISLVFVADEYVYKVKKAVNFGFLDFSTLEHRRHYCQQEVRLNQRLSKGLYLGVLPVVYDGRMHRLGGSGGETVEYAVRMKRIPEDLLMRARFERGELGAIELKAVAQALARFHRQAERSPAIDLFGRAEKFKVNTDENFAQTEPYIGRTIAPKDHDAIRRWTDAFFRENTPVFEARIAAGKIRDCHGDLHMEHVCLTDPVSAIDCIEFNDRFRYTDILADIAFLLMDLEFRGGKGLAEELWQHYSALTRDANMEALLTFYKVYRAYVRGKVQGFQLEDANIGAEEKERAARSARRYFELARTYIG